MKIPIHLLLMVVALCTAATTHTPPRAAAQGGNVTVQGASEAVPGNLVVLVPLNVTGTRTTWNLNYPEAFEQFENENGKLFIAMPNRPISFSLLVIPNDVSLPIQNIRHTITPRAGPVAPEEPVAPVEPGEPEEPVAPEEPEEPTTPPVDPTTSPLYAITTTAYTAVIDPDKAKWAKQMQASFAYVADRAEAGEYATPELMLLDVGRANRGEIDMVGLEPWPEASRKAWAGFRAGIAAGLDKLEAEGRLTTPAAYVPHWRAIAAGLKKMAG